MDLFDVIRSCIKRWYVALPLMLAVTAYALFVYSSAKAVYYASAVIGISPPNSTVPYVQPGTPVLRNGLLEVGGANLITNMATLSLRDPNVIAKVVQAGGTSSYTAKMFPVSANTIQLPLIMIETTRPDAASAAKTIEAVAAQVDPVIRSLQQQTGVPDSEMVGAFVTSSGAPVPATPSRTRSTIAILMAGYGIAVLITVLVDVIIRRRSSGRLDAREMTDRPIGHAVETPEAMVSQ